VRKPSRNLHGQRATQIGLAGAGRYSHTIHVSKFERLRYRYHPHFGKELEVIRKRNRLGHKERITRLPDGTRCVLPAWMFDENYCNALQDMPSAVVSLEALIRRCRVACVLSSGWM